MGGMDAEIGRDVTALDPDLLQLSEVSPLALKQNPEIAQGLYSQWLTLSETSKLVPLL